MTVTLEEVYRLAILEQTTLWSHEKELADQLPDNEYAKAREERAWKKLQEIERQYWELPELKDRYE